MAARESVIVLIAESSVVRAACEPVAVVRSIDETPAPAVAVTVAAPSLRPAAVNAAEVLPETLIPPLSVVDKVTFERVVTVLLVSTVTTVPLIPVTDAVLPVRSRPPVDVNATDPEVLTAVTPVVLLLALMAIARLSNLLAVMAMSVTPPVESEYAVTVDPETAPVVNPAVKVPE